MGPIPILYTNHEVELGGAEHSLLDLLATLDRSRFSPHLACSTDGPLARAASDLDVPVHTVAMRFQGKMRKGFGLIAAARTLRSLIAEYDFPFVHANSLIAGYCTVLATRGSTARSIWHVRDMSYPRLGAIAARRATWRIANSAATAATLDTQDVSVIHNGVGAQFFEQPDTRQDIRSELRLPRRQRLIAMVGRLDPWKGHQVLLDAAARLRARVPNSTFLIVGDVAFDAGRTRLATYRQELERAAANMGMADRVLFLGDRQDVSRILGACDLLVHPSIEPEPFGRAIAEAQAIGLPVVASNLGGIPELIEDRVNGRLVAPSQPAELADALETLLSDDRTRHRMGCEARAKARRCWTARAHAHRVEQVYDSLLQGERPSRATHDTLVATP